MHELKPEMTFRQGLRVLIRWSWLIAIVGIVTAVVVRSAITVNDSHTATVRIHTVDTTVSYSPIGDLVPATVVSRATPSPSAYIVTEPAREAAKSMGARSAEAVISRLSMTPIGPYDADLSYTAPTAAAARAGLNAYVNAYLEFRRAPQEAELRNALAISQEGAPRQRLLAAIDALDTHIRSDPDMRTTHEAATFSLPLLEGGGYLAGIVLASLVVLLFARSSDRIGTASDLRAAGISVIPLDSARDPATLDRLRMELELNGVGRELNVVAVSPLDRGVSFRSLGLQLARLFAAVTPTILIEAAASTDPGNGPRPRSMSGALDRGFDEPNLRQTSAVLVGEEGCPASLGAVDDLVEQARETRDVVIVETPPLVDDLPALALAQAADAILIVVGSRSRWSGLQSAVERVTWRNGSDIRILVCFDTRPHPMKRLFSTPSIRPEAAEAPRAAAEEATRHAQQLASDAKQQASNAEARVAAAGGDSGRSEPTVTRTARGLERKPTNGELQSYNKQKLIELAASMGIDGCSQMTKSELVRAINRAS